MSKMSEDRGCLGKIAMLCVSVACALMFQADLCHAIAYAIDANGNVTWGGDKTDTAPIKDYRVPRKQVGPGSLEFYWTIGTTIIPHPDKPNFFLVTHEPHPSYDKVNEFNNEETGRKLQMFRPNDKNEAFKITGWVAKQDDGLDDKAQIFAGNIKRGSPWEFAPLSEITDAWKIPLFGQMDGDIIGPTIYTAVNLPLYIEKNPFGLLDGQYDLDYLLDDLGYILDGELFASDHTKIEGVYFATSDWGLDPDDSWGFYPLAGKSTLLNSSVFENDFGNIGIKTIYEPVPEPSTVVLFLAGSVGLLWVRRRSKK